MVSKSGTGPDAGQPRRLPERFDDKTRGGQVVAALVGPVVLGVVAGLTLGWTAVAYWLVQVVATVGGVLGGMEHDGPRPAALRGVVGGFLYGGTVLVVHYATGWDEQIDLGSVPPTLVVITSVFGALVGALGGALRARAQRR